MHVLGSLCRQSGSGLPVFYGYASQRGHGLGSILAGFFRSALPMIKKGLGFFGREALHTGAKIVSDVAKGKNVLDSAKSRVSDRINEFAPGLIPQSGSGARRGRKRKRMQKGTTGVSKRCKTTKRRKGRKHKTGAKRGRRRSRVPAAFL